MLSLASDEGHALPLAKVYATLFGGDLKLLSMEGHGTDVPSTSRASRTTSCRRDALSWYRARARLS